MKRPLFQFDPATRKRLKRFRAKKRAWRALIALLALYAVSLGSELICNDRPLLVRCGGRWFFPFLQFHPEDTFLNNGSQTRPDYLKLRRHPLFAESKSNFMLFAPVPYGPYTVIDPADVLAEEKTRLVIQPRPRAGSVNVDSSRVIVRSRAAGYFMGTSDQQVNGMNLTSVWPLDRNLEEAMEMRFSNREAPAVTQTIKGPRGTAEISLSPYTPRDPPPGDVRLILREPASDSRAHVIMLNGDFSIADSKAWNKLDPQLQEQVLAGIPGRTGQAVSSSGDLYDVTVKEPQVRWPHRPVRGHLLGIDTAGRDVFARILYGLRISMTFGFLLVLCSMCIGIFMGAVQGYHGGRLDITIQRFIEIWSALPFLYIMILMGSIYGRSFLLLLFCYGIFNWIGISYYMRGEFLRLRRQAFVDAARCMGIPSLKIMFRHIFPNALIPVVTFFPFSLVGAIGSLTALDYLGFGLPPPTPSWGELLQQAQQFRWAWWLILYPSLALFIVMLLGVFVGEGVRDAYDPKPFSRME